MEATIDDLRQRVEKLEKYDKALEINEYCDGLNGEISSAIRSAIGRLEEYEKELHADVNAYRSELLDQPTEEVEGHSRSAKRPCGLEPEVARLKKEVDEISQKCDINDNGNSILDELMLEVKRLGRQMRQRTFQNKFMRLDQHHQLAELERIVTLKYIDKEPTEDMDSMEIKIRFDDDWETAGEVDRAYFLQNGFVADWSHNFREILHYPSAEHHFFCMSRKLKRLTDVVTFPDGNLAFGTENGHIDILDMKRCRWIKSLREEEPISSDEDSESEPISDLKLLGKGLPMVADPEDTNPDLAIVSLKVLQNGNLASCNRIGSISIWNTKLKENHQLTFDTEPESGRVDAKLGLLSNGDLVSCCSAGVVKVWNPVNGMLVKEIKTQMPVSQLEVLKNDNILLAGPKREMRIYDLTCKKLVHVLNHPGTGTSITLLHSMRSGHLLTGCLQEESKVNVWNPATGRILQTIDLPKCFSWAFVSEDDKHLVTVDLEKQVALWTIDSF